MKPLPVMLIVTSLLICPAWGQSTAERRKAKALAVRQSQVGENLLKWDASRPDGGWSRWWAQSEQAPGFAVDWARGTEGAGALVLTGQGRQHVFGGWKYVVAGIQPGKHYGFRSLAEAKGVPNIRRNILCRVRWTGRDLGSEFIPDYVIDYKKGQGFDVTFDQKFIAPANAEGAVVELLIQWVPTGQVAFREVAFELSMPAPPRIVKMATLYWDGSGAGGAADNLKALSALVDRAAAGKPDVVLLPETITSLGNDLSARDAAEKLPGRVFGALAAKAKEHGFYIIYGTYEKAEDALYNSAVIIARDGTVAGTYRKVQVSPREVEAGVAAGRFFKTFALDFGKVGVLISRDTAFAESARVAMLDGAEIIFVPMRREDLKQLQARAFDNGIWVVSSGFETPSTVIDPAGNVTAIAFKGIGEGVAFSRIDLARKVRRPWVGDWRNQVVKERRTDAYLKIVQE